jgi:hypothetical protein
MEQEERLISADEVQNLRRKFDHPVRLLRLGDELWHIYREDDAGRRGAGSCSTDRHPAAEPRHRAPVSFSDKHS